MVRTLSSQTPQAIGKSVKLEGWVHSRRDHGKIMFLDLRDRSGIVQVVSSKSLADTRPEDCIRIIGTVKSRPDAMANPKMATGTVEVEAAELEIISKARELPFPIDTEGYDIKEENRLKYRYLDIRRPRMTRNLRLKSKMTTFIRNFLTAREFVEVETPILTKTTPEGARDFIVPSRLQKGKFYALPQSPQQYKQLLMVAGLERYFQIARCFRDEDPRKDRAYGEFTQLDMELSFVRQEDILALTEALFTALTEELFPDKRISQTPWPRIPHAQAMKQYGTDKPDLRRDPKDPDELAFAWTIDFPLFTEQSDADYYHGSGAAKFAPSHHMFTAPHPDDISLLDSDPLSVRGLQHDLVLNGYEVGGGSIRIHQRDIQEKVFDLIGFSESQKEQFSHMLTAFTYGVPPHGGIAPGIDRFLFTVLGEPSIREVMAFPTSASGQTSVMDAPSDASEAQLSELGLNINKPKNGTQVYEKIISELQRLNLSYKAFTHQPVTTSAEAAKVRGTPLSWGAKAIIMNADGKPVMIVVAGDRKIDTKKFKQVAGVKDLRMATPEEVLDITAVPIGAVPPFGHIFRIPLYMDEHIEAQDMVVFNAGLHEKSVQMQRKDYVKLAAPHIGEFSK
jgi:aspartyl-tRNA synthetase